MKRRPPRFKRHDILFPYPTLFRSTSGLYHGTQQINQGQMDRWNIVVTLNYLPHDKEVGIVLAKAKSYARDDKGKKTVANMVRLADLTRSAFINEIGRAHV